MTREEKLLAAQREHRQLLDEINELRSKKQPIENRILKQNKRLHRVGQKIYALKHDGVTPEVTDHAIVRYLERVKGMNILDIKVEVAQHKHAHKVGNVIVTVNEDRTEAAT